MIGAATAGIVSATLPAAANAASVGGGEGVNSGSGIIVSAVQGPSNTTVSPQAVSASGVSYSVYKFTNNGTFTVSGGSLNADVLLIGGGGGGGGGYFGGGGGAGEVLPLASKSFVAGDYVVTVGAGGASATDGNPSKITYGSGAVSPGSTWESEARKGLKGGSGTELTSATGGTSGDQFSGGVQAGAAGGGGGGSTAVGSNASSSPGVYNGGAGGAGESVTGYWTSALSVGGGGGGAGSTNGGSATNGGGGGGRYGGGVGGGTAGTANTGGGGGGGYDGSGSAGGSGAIYIRILA